MIYEEVVTNLKFKATLEVNLEFLCCAEGQNKREAKFLCAKIAIFLLAPNAFSQRFPEFVGFSDL